MRLVFHVAAQAELDEAIRFYEMRRPGLGIESLDEVATTVHRIVENPEHFARFSGKTRRAKTRRFPYGIVYANRPGGLHILAVMHLHRRPGYWMRRLS